MIFEELKRKRPAEKDRYEGGTNVLRFLKDFKESVESIYGVSDRDKYDELILWTTGKAKTLIESFRDFSDKGKALSDAKAKLKSFYGSRPRTSTEIFHEILKGKQVGINDLEGLQQLWGELKEAEATAEVHRERATGYRREATQCRCRSYAR